MNKPKIVASIGTVLLLIGIYGLFAALMPGSQTDNFTIPAGEEYYYEYTVTQLMGGHISGDFEVTNAGTIFFFVMNEAQYDSLINDGILAGQMLSLTGDSGDFDLDLSTTGNTYLLFIHNIGSTDIAQNIRLHYLLTGINIPFLIFGIMMMVVGAIMIVLAIRMKKKVSPSEPAVAPQPVDVTMFEKKETQ